MFPEFPGSEKIKRPSDMLLDLFQKQITMGLVLITELYFVSGIRKYVQR